jgi:AcrR family transcriptional regulator
MLIDSPQIARSTDRRSRKRLATRRSIAEAAARLFAERGFDSVTVDAIADAADVGRMTVFNHFPRKEDLFFDPEQEALAAVLTAVRTRRPGLSPLAALHRLAARLIREDAPPLRFSEESRRFVDSIAASDGLKARARALRDEAAQALAAALAEAAGRPETDLHARLAAQLLLATCSVAFIEAHALYRQGEDAAAAKARFLSVVDRGATGVAAALAGTPYA